VTDVINIETGLISIATQELNATHDTTALAPVVEELAGIQEQLVGLLNQEATTLASDPAYQTDLSNMVTNQGALTNLLAQVGSASGSGSSST
jgi:hypothetical protein